ncbi:MAG: hypothetical protein GY821_02770 [Gammaproteobacteria bacterium]|nr:hypothetical protein [Gammaproteobacteria bacterium]
MKKKYTLIFMFALTFLFGYIFRILTFGWMMFILAIPEYLYRSIYYFIGMIILRKDIEQKRYTRSILLQFFYLLASFFSYDGSDTNTYTFAHLWLNPPETIIMALWLCFTLITIGLLTFFFVKSIRAPQLKTPVKKSRLLTISLVDLLFGCLIIPAIAVSTLLFPLV